MTWNEKRIVTILSTTLAVLVVAVLLALSVRYRANPSQATEDPAAATLQTQTADPDAYVNLVLENGSFAPTFSLGETGAWIWADEPDFPLNDQTVQAILAILDDPKPQQTLPMEGGPAEYALESPRATITATRGNGTTRTVLLGKTTTDGQSYYAMLDGDETTVYILAGTLYDLIQTPVYNMMQLPELPNLREDRLLSITLQGQLGDNAAAPLLTLEASRSSASAPTVWTAGDAVVTENPLVRSLLQDLNDLTLSRCVDFDPSEGALEICGLTDPAAVLTVKFLNSADAEQELQLAVGSRVTDGSGRYLQMNGDSTIYFLPTELLDPLMHMAAQGLTE